MKKNNSQVASSKDAVARKQEQDQALASLCYSSADESLNADECLGAYLASEEHIAPILRALLEMNERQRYLMLVMAQGLIAGQPPGNTVPS